jgi:5-methylcytosine-specific restriction endonuclease McrA
MTYKKRIDPDYQNWRNTVLQRDKYQCQMPNCESKHSLVVHHIIPYAKSYALRTDPNNGITLCRKCHKETFGKESIYAHIFLAVIQNGVGNDSRKRKS